MIYVCIQVQTSNRTIDKWINKSKENLQCLLVKCCLLHIQKTYLNKPLANKETEEKWIYLDFGYNKRRRLWEFMNCLRILYNNEGFSMLTKKALFELDQLCSLGYY